MSGKIEYPLPVELNDRLTPLLLKFARELEIKEMDFGEDYTRFVYKGLEVTISIKAKPSGS